MPEVFRFNARGNFGSRAVSTPSQRYCVLSRGEIERILNQMRAESSATVIFYIEPTSPNSTQHGIDSVLDPKTGITLTP